ncbi:MAG: penicillin acylase family protein [Thermoleophilaceae bacterium]
MRTKIWLSVVAAALALLLAAPAFGRDYGGFRDVLPGGQGGTVNAFGLGSYEASGDPPSSFTNQLPLYSGLLYASPHLAPADLDRYFKAESFGTPGSGARAEHPKAGVTIERDSYDVPHVYGATRADTEWGAGYAGAEDRLFFMDVLRHTARGRLSELIGPGEHDSTLQMDANQLKLADYSEEELQRMIDEGAGRDAEARQIKADADSYVAGVNAYISAARTNPTKLPAEYAALGKLPAPWKETDSAAVASLIGTMVGLGGGHEAQVSQVLEAAERRFGRRRGQAVFRDLRRRDDPEAPVTTTRRWRFDRAGRVNRQAVALPDLGSIQPRDPVVSGRSASDRAAGPAWLRRLQSRGVSLGGLGHSNALLVTRRRSSSGRPLAVMGPQVSYYSPEILMEEDLHGPGIDARGSAFPGVNQYVLIGRGPDFAWSATSNESDNVDEFVERLCEPGGSRPTRASTHYVYKGRCRPMVVRDNVLHWTPGPSDLADDPGARPRSFDLRVERSVHGPIQATATVHGRPVAIAAARSTYFHELDASVAFKRLTDGEVHDASDFLHAMGRVNTLFNWFYVDDRDVAWLQSGWFPRRARGTDPSLPTWGTGRWDWRGFDPASFDSQRLGFRQLPKQINPRRGYFTNWNTKPAHGWRSADDHFQYGPVHRSDMLEKRVRAGLRGRRKMSLTDLVRAMEEAATVDLRGQEVYPWMRRVIGRTRDPAARQALRILDAWVRGGAHQRDLDRSGSFDESPAVALMAEWWPRLVRGAFQPALGPALVGRIADVIPFHDGPDTDGDAYFTGWYGYVGKDMRMLLRRRVRGRFSRTYCGGTRRRRGSRRRCRRVLLRTLDQAAAAVRARYRVGRLADVRVPSTCAVADPPACAQDYFTDAGAVSTPPMPLQNRPTFQQIAEPLGHRPR